MNVITAHTSGSPDVLALEQIDRPSSRPGEILVRVRYASVTRGDAVLRSMPRFVLAVVGFFAGFKPMEVPGFEFAGDVEAVGADVSAWSVGDAVCGTTSGLRRGANAEFVVVPAEPRGRVLVRKPEELGYSDAAASLVGGMTAMQLLQPDRIAAGDRVLVYGASGSVGTFALQLAVHAGAHVTGVASGDNLDLVSSLGAERVIDYRTDDVLEGGDRYDLVFDAVGKLPRRRARAILNPGGRFASTRMPTKERAEDVQRIHELIREGKLRVVVDREITLSEVPEAHRLVDSGRKRGHIPVRVAE